MLAYVCLNKESVCSHSLAQRAQRGDRVNLCLMSLLALQLAHLRDEGFRATNLHAVNDVSDLHYGNVWLALNE